MNKSMCLALIFKYNVEQVFLQALCALVCNFNQTVLKGKRDEYVETSLPRLVQLSGTRRSFRMRQIMAMVLGTTSAISLFLFFFFFCLQGHQRLDEVVFFSVSLSGRPARRIIQSMQRKTKNKEHRVECLNEGA